MGTASFRRRAEILSRPLDLLPGIFWYFPCKLRCFKIGERLNCQNSFFFYKNLINLG